MKIPERHFASNWTHGASVSIQMGHNQVSSHHSMDHVHVHLVLQIISILQKGVELFLPLKPHLPCRILIGLPPTPGKIEGASVACWEHAEETYVKAPCQIAEDKSLRLTFAFAFRQALKGLIGFDSLTAAVDQFCLWKELLKLKGCLSFSGAALPLLYMILCLKHDYHLLKLTHCLPRQESPKT